MQEVYASLLLHAAKQPITEENIKKVLQSAGGSVDEGRIKALVASLEGQNIDELIQQASVAQPQPTAEKKEGEEEKEEKSIESAAAGLSLLFG